MFYLVELFFFFLLLQPVSLLLEVEFDLIPFVFENSWYAREVSC